MTKLNESNPITMEYEYKRGDSCYATVIGRNKAGSYLRLDNGQLAFSYHAANLKKGTKILCYIAGTAREGKNTLAWLDSICGADELVASA